MAKKVIMVDDLEDWVLESLLDADGIPGGPCDRGTYMNLLRARSRKMYLAEFRSDVMIDPYPKEKV